MTPRYLVIGTAGHIDHGKTSLVRALTGVDTDRLVEEKRRGITIELGFAPWRVSDEVEATIVDVPGHERLVRTMVAGAGGIDLALLVVAADDGVMPQTREHLDVLKLLAVPRGIVVLSKCDGVDAEILALVEEDVRAACRDTPFAEAPVVRVSSKTGEGLAALRAEVVRAALEVAPRPAAGSAFLPLDRVFVMSGYGTVATGTLLRGTLRTGDPVEAWGETREPVRDLKIRGLQALGREREAIPAGMRTAVNLAGRDVESVSRGMVLAPPGAFVAVDACIAWVEALARAKAMGDETVTVHLGTSERQARVIPLGKDKIAPGESAGVLLRFSRPVAAFAGQRLVLRRPGIHGQATVAGGSVLDPEPPRGKGGVALAASQVAGLRGSAGDRLLAIARESRARGVDAAEIERRLPP
ncbi:MAG: selenocysteine-specific translation elongation factor, partial [Deltaproteobacteria bacterium]|nr:selenocysteine-specific translation elongation factor [Deltaproteobacteria bacterium]